jgi:D-xylose 1-dehydrogenase (NADP+, D-xylono-1,5-lactone-forming)
MISTSERLKSAMPRKLKWGVAGCGNFTENHFLPVMQVVQRSKLVSVYSHDLNRAKDISNKFGAQNAFDDFDQFLASGIEAVYISGKNSDHYKQVIKAAEAGKNILCEQPIALDSKQAEEMVNFCKAKNVILAINHLHRYHPLVLKAKELLNKHMLGKIISISASCNVDRTPDDNFRFTKELSGGGVLRDLGLEWINMLQYFGGEITEVKAFKDNIIYKSEVEDFAAAILKFEKSGYGFLNLSCDSKKLYNKIEVLGYNGLIAIEEISGKRSTSVKLIIDLQGETKRVFRKRTNKLLFMLRSIQKSFIRNILPVVTGEDELAGMKIIEKIERQCR